MRKIFFLRSGYETNSAAFNRLLTIMKAVKLAGFDVQMVNIRPVPDEKKSEFRFSDKYNYMIDGIRSRVIKFRSEVSSNPVMANFKSMQATSNYLNIAEGKDSVIYLYSVNVFDIFWFYFASRSLKMKFTTENSEYPETVRNPNSLKAKIFNKLVLPISYKTFDGIVLMTETLISFYSGYLKKDCKIVHVPMTVDGERFAGENENGDYFAYIGSLNCKKDGLDLLLQSVAEVKKDYPGIKLKIAGGTNNKSEEEFLFNLREELGLTENVEFLGWVKREDVVPFLKGAKSVVLPRPASKQAEGGFPTKLGEYLLSGKPVIVTSVGEIPKYMKNLETCYLINPGDKEALTASIKNVLGAPEEASAIGERGRVFAMKTFDYRANIETLKEYFQKI